ncbi:MAG: DNA polymerase beta superfamily protein [Hyphomicrobiaceae bacterium]
MATDDVPGFNVVSDEMRAHVEATLADVAREHDVRILFAAESGSRAWGFASPDSDYDVRFIYAHQRDWYTSLREGRDVIERPLDSHLVDLAGWDVRKALRLLLKSNPPLYEWFLSPIVYTETGAFRAQAQELFERHASPRVLAHAYYAIAKGMRPERGAIGADEVKLKRYFYLIRPLLSLQWIVENETLPPMNLQQLMRAVALPADVAGAIEELHERKRSTPELGFGRRVAVIDAWVAGELERLRPENLELGESDESETIIEADALFRRTVGL